MGKAQRQTSTADHHATKAEATAEAERESGAHRLHGQDRSQVGEGRYRAADGRAALSGATAAEAASAQARRGSQARSGADVRCALLHRLAEAEGQGGDRHRRRFRNRPQRRRAVCARRRRCRGALSRRAQGRQGHAGGGREEPQMHSHCGDVATPRSARRGAKVVKTFGKLDILVNNAAFRARHAFEVLTESTSTAPSRPTSRLFPHGQGRVAASEQGSVSSTPAR